MTTSRRSERGATTIMVAAMIACLLAAGGIGIDTTTMAYQRSRVQHGADAGALAIARTCAEGSCNAGLASTYRQANAEGGGSDVAPSVTYPTAGTVKVSLTRNVTTIFFGLLGTSSKAVAATSTAQWGSPTSGSVIPFIVSLCEYTNADIGVSTFIDADANDRLQNNGTYKDKQQQVLVTQNDLVGCGTIPSGVSGVPNNSRMIKGGLWINEHDNCGANINNGKVQLDLDAPTMNDICANNTNGTEKYGADLPIGGTALFAIYAPARNYTYGGVYTVGGGTAPTDKIDGKPRFATRLVGFSPFVVSGYCLGKGSSKECKGNYTTGKVGIWGKFTNEIHPDADYSTTGPDIGTAVRLTD